jgi:UDP-GlcNAc:undecaprenyl-phosphate GlcNAc-1-phosphate transferase
MIVIQVIILIFVSWLYMKIALSFGIIDTPNYRSSHNKPTIRGGGIIFVFAALLFFLGEGFQYPFFYIGLLLIAVISFLDDIFSLSSMFRLFIQILTILLAVYNITFFDISVLMICIIVLFIVGLLNIYNFMDGINGITGLYSMVIIIPLLYVNNYVVSFVDNQLLVLCFISLVIFGFYNFRRVAKCFAGDVGSVSIGLILIFSTGLLINSSNTIVYVLFFCVYLIDGGITILERLLRKENILSPHRRHLYQLLVDKKQYSHIKVSLLYSVVQLLISFLIIKTEHWSVPYLIIILILTIYIVVKIRVLQKINF